MKKSYAPSIISFTTARLMMDFAASALTAFFPEAEDEEIIQSVKEFFPAFCDEMGIKGVTAYDRGRNNWDNE